MEYDKNGMADVLIELSGSSLRFDVAQHSPSW